MLIHILDSSNVDDFLLKCAIDQSLSQDALVQNTLEEKSEEVPPKSLEEALEKALKSVPTEQFTFIEITRKNIVSRVFECLEDEDVKARVTVKFIGEDAIDSGGVTREFFSEFFRGFGVYSTLVRGTYPCITFRHNLEALDKGLFELFGKLVAIAIINGCPGPHFFTRMVAGFILDIPQEPDLDEVPHECEFLTKLKTISSCCDEASFLDAVNSFPERFDMGYTKATVTLEDKNDLLNACIKHIVIYSTAEEIYSFRKGLASFGVKELLCRFPSDGIKKLMHVEVSVEDVKSCFLPCFSTPRIEVHEKETEIVYNWHSFLRSVSKGKLKCHVYSYLETTSSTAGDHMQNDAELKVLTLSDVLQFGSGSRFPNFSGKLVFDHDSGSVEKRISANTCSLTITIPVNKRYTCSSNEFSFKFMEDIFEDHGFGLP